MKTWQGAFYCVFVPEYFGQPWSYESTAWVRKQARSGEAPAGRFPGYYLLVEFHHYRDHQSIYPKWWKPRQQWVRVSKRLYDTKPHSLQIFYRFSRHYNETGSVQVKIAR